MAAHLISVFSIGEALKGSASLREKAGITDSRVDTMGQPSEVHLTKAPLEQVASVAHG